MKFDFEQFCKDKNIRRAQSGHKHTRPGWIQVPCPFCTGNPGYHLGFNLQGGYFNCWRCGWKSVVNVVMELTNETQYPIVARIIQSYKSRTIGKEEVKEVEHARKLILPKSFASLSTRHERYLLSRSYRSPATGQMWDLKGTGRTGPYAFRIIAPIYFEGQLVSYQGRDITGKSPLKYKACKKEHEVRDHKHCLYGYDLAVGDSVVVVEGVTDVWRLGPGAVATFGIKYTVQQMKLLLGFKYVFVFFDTADSQARRQGDKLANELATMGRNVETIETDWDDPADMPQKEADKLMKELGCKGGK